MNVLDIEGCWVASVVALRALLENRRRWARPKPAQPPWFPTDSLGPCALLEKAKAPEKLHCPLKCWLKNVDFCLPSPITEPGRRLIFERRQYHSHAGLPH